MSHRSAAPVIVLGCPRSGTTLLRRLFDAHGAFSCPGESFVLRGAARFLRGERVAEGIEYGPLGGLAALGFSAGEVRERLRRMALSFHEDIAAKEGKPRVVLKTAVDSFYAREVHAIFAGHAKFVCLVRHGADVALSLRDFTQAMEGVIEELLPFVEAHRRTLPAFAAAWTKVTTDLLDLAEASSDEVLALRYEDLVEDPRAVLEHLFGFLGAPCAVDSVIAEAFRPREVRGLGDYKTYATQRIESASVGRWQSLSDRIKAELAPILNPVLKRAGYEQLQVSPERADDAMRFHELAMMFQAANRSGPTNE